MRGELYNALIEALKKVDDGAIKHIDLWNENVYFIDEETAFEMPAVFVEFGEINWSSNVGKSHYRGTGTLNLHIVTPWNGSAAADSPDKDILMKSIDLSKKIHKEIVNIKSAQFNGLELLRTITNHNHAELLENIEVYGVKYVMEV